MQEKSPYEQGRTDSFYRRRPRATELYVNAREIAEYEAGYDYNDAHGEYKDYDDWDVEVTEDEMCIV